MTQQAMVLSADAEQKIDVATGEIYAAQAAIEGLANLLMTIGQVGDDDSVDPCYQKALARRVLDALKAIELSAETISRRVATIEKVLWEAKGATATLSLNENGGRAVAGGEQYQ